MRLPSFPSLLGLVPAWAAALLLAGTLQAQGPDCTRYREGKFVIGDEHGGLPTEITRKGNKQRERSGGTELTFHVTWLDECTYTLRIDKVVRNPDEQTFDPDMVLKVEIIDTDSDSYVQRSTAPEYGLVYISTVRVAK